MFTHCFVDKDAPYFYLGFRQKLYQFDLKGKLVRIIHRGRAGVVIKRNGLYFGLTGINGDIAPDCTKNGGYQMTQKTFFTIAAILMALLIGFFAIQIHSMGELECNAMFTWECDMNAQLYCLGPALPHRSYSYCDGVDCIGELVNLLLGRNIRVIHIQRSHALQ